MENDQTFEADASIDATDRAREEVGLLHGNGAAAGVAGTGSFDKNTATAIAQENEPLLGESRDSSPAPGNPSAWQGDADFAGMTWWQRPSV